ncbi:hypothetical protein KUCAC02_008595 [Chaenocephalus aceratus]|uniref:Uncharacterized protein n=1 Tax=Chaenocephalus aceratus TaxID=36190 RepID=A0ACB9WRV2_CHAAC|nr:hypothetical protein KUCAC02_008595 [Chaenocephalus aceratus]
MLNVSPRHELNKDYIYTEMAKVGLANEALAQDIEDPAACSIESEKQKLDKDRQRREAELKIAAKQNKLAELNKKFQQLLITNQRLPEHVRLKPEVRTPGSLSSVF